MYYPGKGTIHPSRTRTWAQKEWACHRMSPLSKAAAWAAILSVPIAIYFGQQDHNDAQHGAPSLVPPSNQPGPIGTSPPGTGPTEQQTPQSRVSLWQGEVRITSNGVNLNGRAPAVGDPSFSTILYRSNNNAFSTNNSPSAALWNSAQDPTYEQCLTQLGTQALSYNERHKIPYQPDLALCVKTFGGDNIAFIRIVQPPSGEGAQAFAIMWTFI